MKNHKHQWDEEDMSPEAIASRAIHYEPSQANYKQVLREIRCLVSASRIKGDIAVRQLVYDAIIKNKLKI